MFLQWWHWACWLHALIVCRHSVYCSWNQWGCVFTHLVIIICQPCKTINNSMNQLSTIKWNPWHWACWLHALIVYRRGDTATRTNRGCVFTHLVIIICQPYKTINNSMPALTNQMKSLTLSLLIACLNSMLTWWYCSWNQQGMCFHSPSHNNMPTMQNQ